MRPLGALPMTARLDRSLAGRPDEDARSAAESPAQFADAR